MISTLVLTLPLWSSGVVFATAPLQDDSNLEPAPRPSERILPLRERAALRDAWLERRLDAVIPRIMREAGVDLWILIAREYNEDPVVETMLPATWLAARRRTILVFHDPATEADPDLAVRRLAIARYDVGSLFPSAWNKEEEPDQWKCLAELVSELDPKKIALNVSRTFALGDGLSASQNSELLRRLEPRLLQNLDFEHNLPIRWLESRIPEERDYYPEICAIAHEIIAEGLSNAAVRPGETTTEDLEWWFRERIVELHLDTWFHPSVSVQRAEGGEHSGSFASSEGARTIERGDLVHVDFGITYLGLNTDTQQHAYVLREGETEAPQGLRDALAIGNQLQDILMAEFELGRTGNTILLAARAAAKHQGIDSTIYTHPLGLHGHGAGPTIGLWDQQGGVPGSGEYVLHADTAYSIELNAAVAIPEWDDQSVRIMLEEDAFFDGRKCEFLDGRQTEFLLIQ